MIGSRAGDTETGGYEALLTSPSPAQALVHVLPDPDELGRVYRRPSRSSLVRLPRFAAALEPVDGSRWAAWTAPRRADYVANLEPRASFPATSTCSPSCATSASVAGRSNPHERRRATSPCGRTASTSSATTGHSSRRRAARWATGVPAAIAARLLEPEVPIVCFAGDGDFVMSVHGARDRRAARSTARRPRVRQRDVRDDPHAPGAPLPGARLRHRPRQPRFRRARPRVRVSRRASSSGPSSSPGRSSGRSSAGVPAVVQLVVDPEALTPRLTLGEIRENALRRGMHRIAGTPTPRSGGRMARSYMSTVIDRPASEVWATIRDFNGLATWFSEVVVAERDRGRARAATRSARSAASRSATAPTSASGCSATPTPSARTRTTSRRRRSTSTATTRRSR